jgi:hypothetical protein
VYSQQIVELDLKLRDALMRYGAAHDGLFAKWWMSWLPGPRRKADPHELYAEALSVEKALGAMRDEAVSLMESAWGADRDYAESLSRVVAGVFNAASLLAHVAEGIVKKAGLGRAARKAHLDNLRAYQQSRLRLPALQRELDAKWQSYLPAMFDDLFDQRSDPLMRRAQQVVQSAALNAVATFAALAKQFPMLLDADTGHWDYIHTVAAALVALVRLGEQRLGKPRQQKLVAVIQSELVRRFGEEATAAVEDCGSNLKRYSRLLADKGQRSEYMIYDAVGFWIVWNLIGRWPERDEELKLVRATGTLTGQPWSTWWQARPAESVPQM